MAKFGFPSVEKSPLKIITLGVALWVGTFCGQCVAGIVTPLANSGTGAAAVTPTSWIEPFNEAVTGINLAEIPLRYRDVIAGIGGLDLKKLSKMRIAEPFFLQLEKVGLRPETFRRRTLKERQEAILRAAGIVVSDMEGKADALMARLDDKDLGPMQVSAVVSELERLRFDYSVYLSPSHREAVSISLVRSRKKLDESKWSGIRSKMQSMARESGIPLPSLGHLRTLTDDTGIFEHARRDIPNKEDGYRAEDAGRALVAALMFNKDISRRSTSEDLKSGDPADKVASELAKTYLSYLDSSQEVIWNGDFHHRMNPQRELSKDLTTDDAYGQVLWGLGYAVANPIDHGMGAAAKDMFEKALPRVRHLKQPRAIAYTMLGFYYYLERFPRAEEVKSTLANLAERLLVFRVRNSSDGWPWFEDSISYDSARLPQALFLAYETTRNVLYLHASEEALDFLIQASFPDGKVMQATGYKGGKSGDWGRVLSDERPMDAASMVEACALAYRLLGLEKYREIMRSAFEWFLGWNVFGAPIYDASTGGARDGFSESEVNENEGAESSSLFLIALLTIRQVLGI